MCLCSVIGSTYFILFLYINVSKRQRNILVFCGVLSLDTDSLPEKKLFYDLGSLLSTAVRKEDERIVSCLRGSDAVAKEVRYHPSCFRSYCFDTEYKTNRYLLPFRTFNSLVVLGRFLALFHRIVR